MGKTSAAAVARYRRAHYDSISVDMPRGSRAVLSRHAAQHDASLAAWLRRAIVQAMQDDGADPADIDVVQGRHTQPTDGDT